ncbi:MAG: helicase associated domain-containing protein, partial [Coraliomargaritaceae bacterium]
MSESKQERKEEPIVRRSYGPRDHERFIVRLQRHIEKHGPLEHTRHESIDGGLVQWSRYVRSHMDKISDQWVVQLKEAGFFNYREQHWLEMLERVMHFKEGAAGRSDSTVGAKACYNWSYNQRRQRERLLAYQIVLLDRAGFDWKLKTRKLPMRSWEEQFQRLLAYRERFGHCRVPAKWPEDSSLAQWVDRMRRMYKNGELSEDRVERLESIGFVWYFVIWSWEKHFAQLEAFHAKHGHCRVTVTDKKNRLLAIWVGNMRARKDRLSAEQVARMDALGFHWDMREDVWEQSFRRLREGVRRNGGVFSPKVWRRDNSLKTWVISQRQKNREGAMPEDHRKRLESIGFMWAGGKAKYWEQKFAALEDFKNRFGHCRVRCSWEEDPLLFCWVDSQRQKYRLGLLPEDRRKRLEKLGFIWNVHDLLWEESFAALKRFQECFGHCRVPKGWKESPRLNVWVNFQRKKWRMGTIKKDRLARLEALGFEWELDLNQQKEEIWQSCYASLLAYKAVHGHCRVSKNDVNDAPLRRWVAAVRRGDFELTSAQRQALNQIGFVWKIADWEWDQKFARLERFRERFGHCRVPSKWKEDRSLVGWVRRQRKRRLSGKI